MDLPVAGRFKMSQKCHSLPVVHLHRCSSSGRLVVAPAVGPLGMHSIETVSKAEIELKSKLPPSSGRPDPNCLWQFGWNLLLKPKSQELLSLQRTDQGLLAIKTRDNVFAVDVKRIENELVRMNLNVLHQEQK